MKPASEFPKGEPPSRGVRLAPGRPGGSGQQQLVLRGGARRADPHAPPGGRRRRTRVISYSPSVTSTSSVAVPAGAIGAVVCVRPASSPPVSNVSACSASVWLDTISRIGPAPNRRGETATLLVGIAAVTLIDAGGRSRLAWSSSLAAAAGGERGRQRRVHSPMSRIGRSVYPPGGPVPRFARQAVQHRVRAVRWQAYHPAPGCPSLARLREPRCASRSPRPSSWPSTPRRTGSRASAAS